MSVRTAEVHVKVADLPEVRAAIAAQAEAMKDAATEVRTLRSLLQAWEPRVRCPQCGQRYSGTACGPAHAIIWHRVSGGTP